MSKIDLGVATKLVAELTSQNSILEKLKDLSTKNKQEYIVELSKALGLVMALKLETEMLIGDYSNLIKFATYPNATQATSDALLSSLFPDMKLPKN